MTGTSKTEAAADASASNKENNSSAAAGGSGGPPSAIEFEPPLACVRRILKNSLPSSTNVGKDASAAFARASGIFIIYLTACANDFARENRRQTITANDVLAAIKELEFDEFTPELTKFLERYRESEKSKKEAKAKAKEEEAANANKEGEDAMVEDADHGKDADAATPATATLPSSDPQEKNGDAKEVEAAEVATPVDTSMLEEADDHTEGEDRDAITEAGEEEGLEEMEE